MESIEKKYKNLIKDGEVETAREMIRAQFEELLRKNDSENISGKEGYVFVCSGRNEDDENFKALVEFSTADEARDWYESDGRAIIEDGGEVRLNYGPSELNK